jgi:hypothetical protein
LRVSHGQHAFQDEGWLAWVDPIVLCVREGQGPGKTRRILARDAYSDFPFPVIELGDEFEWILVHRTLAVFVGEKESERGSRACLEGGGICPVSLRIARVRGYIPGSAI